MGMLLRRHYATVEPVKPVEQTEIVSVEEKPQEDIKQASVTEELPVEPEKEEKPKRTRTVTKKPTTRKLTRKSK